MFRGIFMLMAFCLSLVVLWRVADLSSGPERLLQEHYATEGSADVVDADEGMGLGAAARPVPKWHRCEFEPFDCDDLGCDRRRQASFYSKLQ